MITFHTVPPQVSRGCMSIESISLDSHYEPNAAPDTGDLVPVFKELRRSSLFTIRIFLLWKDGETEVLKDQALCPGP